MVGQSQLLGLILLKGGTQVSVLAKERVDILAGLHAKRADEDRERHLAVLVDADVHHAGGVDLILQPCAAIGDDGGRIGLLSRLVDLGGIVHAGRTNDLGNDNALCTVDHKGSRLGHEREIAHEDVGLLDLARLLVGQADVDLEGCGVVNVALLALLHRILGVLVIQGKGNEFDHQIAGIVGNRGGIAQNLHQTLVLKPLVGLRLDLDQIRQRVVEVGSREALSGVLTKLLILQIDH